MGNTNVTGMISIESRDIDNSSVFRCRKCHMPVSETVPSAAYDTH